MKRLLTILLVICGLVGAPAKALSLESVGQPLQFFPTDRHPLPDPEDWTPFNPVIPHDDATLLFRQTINVALAPDKQVSNPLALGVSLYGIYDFYWDGKLVGSTRQQGRNANRHSRVMIPVQGLTAGDHVLEMRITALGLKGGDSLDLWVRPAAIQADFFGVHWSVISTFFVATASLLVGCYLLLLRITGGKSPALPAAAAVCFCIFALILLEEGQYLFSYPYSWQPLLNGLKPPLAIALYCLLAWVTITRLAMPKRRVWVAAAVSILVAGIAALPEPEKDSWILALLQIFLIAAAAFAALRDRKTPGLFFWGHCMALVALAIDPASKHPYLVAITILLAIDLGLDIKRRTMEAQRLALVSERLRADLIKRNIQPHFLMNSLTALMEWVETSPADAVDFIDGLADEFRLLAEFADRRSVTLREELNLCNVHLRLMEKRFEASATIDTDGIDLDAILPPGILHTLLENAFSHNNYSGRTVRFHLTATQLDTGTRYILRCPIAASSTAPGLGTGTGTRYVIARLEEFCGKAFGFHARQLGPDWETTIEIGQHGH